MGDHFGQVWKLGGRFTAESERKNLPSKPKGLRGRTKIRSILSCLFQETVSRRKGSDKLFFQRQNEIRTESVHWISY